MQHIKYKPDVVYDIRDNVFFTLEDLLYVFCSSQVVELQYKYNIFFKDTVVNLKKHPKFSIWKDLIPYASAVYENKTLKINLVEPYDYSEEQMTELLKSMEE